MFLFTINLSIKSVLLSNAVLFSKVRLGNIVFGIQILKYKFLGILFLLFVSIIVIPCFHSLTAFTAMVGSFILVSIGLYYSTFMPYAYYYHNLALIRFFIFTYIVIRIAWVFEAYYSLKLGNLNCSLPLEMNLPTGLFGCPDGPCTCGDKTSTSVIQKTKAAVEQTISAATVPGVGAHKFIVLHPRTPLNVRLVTAGSYGAFTLGCCTIQFLSGASVGSFSRIEPVVEISSWKPASIPQACAPTTIIYPRTITMPVISDAPTLVQPDLMCENPVCRSKSIPSKMFPTPYVDNNGDTRQDWTRLRVVHEPCGFRKVLPVRPTWTRNG